MKHFSIFLKESKLDKILDKILSKILSKYENELNENSCMGKLKSAISEFIEIEEFKKLVDPRKKGITINGEFRGGENGSSHIILNCESKKINLSDMIDDLNKNLKQINLSL